MKWYFVMMEIKKSVLPGLIKDGLQDANSSTSNYKN